MPTALALLSHREFSRNIEPHLTACGLAPTHVRGKAQAFESLADYPTWLPGGTSTLGLPGHGRPAVAAGFAAQGCLGYPAEPATQQSQLASFYAARDAAIHELPLVGGCRWELALGLTAEESLGSFLVA
jgi:hypothetical protein